MLNEKLKKQALSPSLEGDVAAATGGAEFAGAVGYPHPVGAAILPPVILMKLVGCAGARPLQACAPHAFLTPRGSGNSFQRKELGGLFLTVSLLLTV